MKNSLDYGMNMNLKGIAEKEIIEEDKKSIPLYTIGIVAELIGITSETLRLYEKHGLIRPARKNRKRFYSVNDLRWIQCLSDLIHNKKISIEGIKKLLNYAPCWEITECSKEARDECSAYTGKTKPYWELNNQSDMHKGNIVKSSALT